VNEDEFVSYFNSKLEKDRASFDDGIKSYIKENE